MQKLQMQQIRTETKKSSRMGGVKNYPPCLAFVASFSRYGHVLDWVWEHASKQLGRIALLSPRYDFQESAYYQKSMGQNLLKQFAIFEPWYDPADLAQQKILSNAWEDLSLSQFNVLEERPINIDPGYISLTKLVLASTKNREHRIYLRDGIYAEVTLVYRNQDWLPMPWTYPDYQREDFRLFFHDARKYLLTSISKLDAHDK